MEKISVLKSEVDREQDPDWMLIDKISLPVSAASHCSESAHLSLPTIQCPPQLLYVGVHKEIVWVVRAFCWCNGRGTHVSAPQAMCTSSSAACLWGAPKMQDHILKTHRLPTLRTHRLSTLRTHRLPTLRTHREPLRISTATPPATLHNSGLSTESLNCM
jgi:hypothetical protein